jgi:sugar/nucleoside kinase (ribokinase family)
MHFKLCIVGACHTDVINQITGPTRNGRTNPGTKRCRPGGVAANIARYTRQYRADLEITFIGAEACGANNVVSHLREIGIEVNTLQLKGLQPSYNAILDRNGDLIIGVANMELYDSVAPVDMMPLLPEKPHALIIDANFPEETLVSVALSLSDDCQLYAAGTSLEKVRRLSPIMARLDALALNRAEASELVGKTGNVEDLAIALATKLREHAHVIVSDGESDAALISGGNLVVDTPPKIILANANGAGDVMAATFFCLCTDNILGRPGTPINLEDMLSNSLAQGANFAAGAVF